MKRLITGIALSALTSLALAAETITFSIPWPPGGTADRLTAALVAPLERQGISVNRTFYKSCAQAAAAVAAAPSNNFLSSITGDIIFSNLTKGSACPPLALIPGATLQAVLSEAPLLVCSAPKNISKTVKEVAAASKTRSVTVGYSGEIHRAILTKIQAHPGIGKIVPVPYAGGGAMRIAAVSGDVDYIMSASACATLAKQNQTTVVASTQASADVPFIANVFEVTGEFPEVALQNFLVGQSSSITSTVAAGLAHAMASPEYAAAAQATGATLPAGSTGELLGKLIAVEEMLDLQ